MQDHSCSQRFLRVNIDSTAEHSRSSGVFSRRRVAVNGSAAARPVTLCRALSRWRRAPAPDDTLWRLAAVTGCRATVGGACKSGRGCIAKKCQPPRRPPACFFAAETTSVGGADLAFSLLSVCLAAKTCRCESGQAHRVHLANFFGKPSALFVSAPTTTTAGPLSPFFATVKKWPFRLIIFGADHLHGWRPYRSLSLLFSQLSKITNRT